ncbi:MAG: ATP-binding protein, partial [Nitrospirae bacterium]|nr:ATP-binding protein [Nitrospirota bacterium]
FLQQKYFLDKGNINYLQNKLVETKEKFGDNEYYATFLKALFFEGFAKPEEDRSPEARKLLGDIKYLNGGLFLPHRIENDYRSILIPDKAFENIFQLFGRYSWNLNDIPGGKDDEINPDVLGYIFEKYINQKAFGAYYTRPEITEYLCESTIYKLILDKINTPGIPGILLSRQFDSIAELLLNLDASLCRELLMDILPSLSLLDPACGSGAFLVAAMKTLINLYSPIIGKITFINDKNLTDWLHKKRIEHKSLSYFIKKTIITDNLFGVDIMEEAIEIARLRLFLALVASASSVDELEPLPNIDFNLLVGNSLVGLMHVDDKEFENRTSNLFRKRYTEVLDEKNRLIDNYRHAATYATDLRALRDDIEQKKAEARGTLNEILLDEFSGNLGIKFEEATWDESRNKEGKPIKRKLAIKDIEALTPFHWGYEFDEILNKRGGFDAIITNPPWEIFKPQAKEFCSDYSRLITKNKMTFKEFEKEQSKLMKDPEIRNAWVEYQGRFPYVSQYFRSSSQYKNQIAIVNGKKAGTDINLYKLFVEQCYNLIRPDGECGIVIPSGIYTDLGTKQLREMLFDQTDITGLFCFENRKGIFEGVDSRFKFVVLTYKKGGKTEKFPAAFMRHDANELERFPKEKALDIPIDLIRMLWLFVYLKKCYSFLF